MAKISGNDIRPGMVIEHEGSLWAAVKTMAVKPGKGPAYNQVELKNLLDGRKLNQRFGGSDRVEETEVERRSSSSSTSRATARVHGHRRATSRSSCGEDFVGDRAAFLQDGMMVQVQLHGDRPIGIKLPETVVLEVVEADALIKGQTAASSYKPAKLENGLRVLVPPFIPPARRSWSRPTKSPTCAGRSDAALRPPQCHDRRRAQGRARAQARLRRGREPAGLAQGTGQFRHRRRPQGRGNASTPNWPRRGPATASSARKAAATRAPTRPTPGSSIRSTAPPTSCTASRSSPSRSGWSARARSSRA